jgi:hypothetical protein
MGELGIRQSQRTVATADQVVSAQAGALRCGPGVVSTGWYPWAYEDSMATSDETTAVVIYTETLRIEGRVALVPGARLTDFIRGAPEFVAITDAVVFDRHEKRLFSAEFIDVGREVIELIVPASLIKP